MDKKAFYKIGYGLYVITTNDGAKDNGMINNAFMQITTDPCEVAVAVNKANYTRETAIKTGKFNISVLSEDVSFDVIRRFGFQSGRDADKFDGFDSCFRMPNGIMALNNRYANAFFTCKVKDTMDFSTHTLFRAEVTDAVLLSEKTCTYDFYQKNVKPKRNRRRLETVWRCTVCGYEYEAIICGSFVCPVCSTRVRL
ncbi:MAG: flavin reductase [Eubacteriales bacterium]